MRSVKDTPRVGWLLLATGMVFLLLGVIHGDARQVYLKAVRICLECIGIG